MSTGKRQKRKNNKQRKATIRLCGTRSRKLTALFMAVVMVLSIVSPFMGSIGLVYAETFIDTTEGITWYYTESEGKAINVYTTDTITGLLKIPDEIEGLPVTSIGGGTSSTQVAPNGYSGVILPTNLVAINPYAFYNATSLVSVSAKGSQLNNIYSYAFAGCTTLDSIKLNDVTVVGEHAFEGCTALTGAKLPNVATVGEYAFKDCTAFIGMDLLNARDIKANAFEGCTAMTYAKLSAYLETIGAQAFKNCTSLEKIYVADTVTSVGAGAFEGCTGLTMAQLDANVDYSGAFIDCHSLTDIVFGKKVEAVAADAFGYSAENVSVENMTFDTDSAINYYFRNPATKVYYSYNAEVKEVSNIALTNGTHYTGSSNVTQNNPDLWYAAGASSANIGNSAKGSGSYEFYSMGILKNRINYVNPQMSLWSIFITPTLSFQLQEGCYVGYNSQNVNGGICTLSNSIPTGSSNGNFSATIVDSRAYDISGAFTVSYTANEDVMNNTYNFTDHHTSVNKGDTFVPTNIYVNLSKETPAGGTNYAMPKNLAEKTKTNDALTYYGESSLNIYDINTVSVPSAVDPNATKISEINAEYDGAVAIGKEIDKASVTLKLTYNDYSTVNISGADAGVTYDTTTVSVKGNNAITVTYEGFSDTFNVIGVAGKFLKATLNTSYLDSLGEEYTDWNVSKQAFKQNAVVTKEMFDVSVVINDGNSTEEIPTTDFSFKTDTVSAIGDNEIVIISNNDNALKAAVTVKGYNESLSDTMEDLGADSLEELKDKASELKTDLAEAKNDLILYQESLDTIQEQLNIQVSTNEQLSGQLETLQSQKDALNSQLEALEDQNSEQAQVIKDKIAEISAKEDKIKELQAQVDTINSQIHDLQTDIVNYEAGMKEVQTLLNGYLSSENQIDPDEVPTIESIKNQIRAFYEEYEEVSKKAQAMADSFDRLKAQLGLNKDATVEDVEKKVEEINNTLNSTKTQLDGYKATLDEIKGQLADKGLSVDETKSLEEQLKETTDKIQQAITDLDNTQKELDEIQNVADGTYEGDAEKLGETAKKVNDLKELATSLEAFSDSIASKLGLSADATKEEILATIEELLESASSGGSVDFAKIKELEQKVSDLTKENEELVTKNTELASENATLKQNISNGSNGSTNSDIVDTSSASYKAGYAAGSQNNSSQSTINALVAQTSSLSSENAKLTKENTQLSEDNKTLNEQVDILSDGIEELYDAIPTATIAGTYSVGTNKDTSTITNRVSKVKTYYKSLNGKVAELEKEVKVLEGQLEDSDADKEALTEKINKLRKQIDSLKNQSANVTTSTGTSNSTSNNVPTTNVTKPTGTSNSTSNSVPTTNYSVPTTNYSRVPTTNTGGNTSTTATVNRYSSETSNSTVKSEYTSSKDDSNKKNDETAIKNEGIEISLDSMPVTVTQLEPLGEDEIALTEEESIADETNAISLQPIEEESGINAGAVAVGVIALLGIAGAGVFFLNKKYSFLPF